MHVARPCAMLDLLTRRSIEIAQAEQASAAMKASELSEARAMFYEYT